MITSQNVVESLARGFIPNSRSTLFQATKPTLVVEIAGRNEDNLNIRRFNIFTKVNGTSIGKTPTNCLLAPGYSYCKLLPHSLLLKAGDSIEGDCDSNNAISFEVSGINDL